MRWNKWLHSFALIAVITVTGCNIFNPDGEGDPGDAQPLTVAQEYLRNGQYAKAMSAFDRAIRQDSTNSLAYYGYAKAAILLYKLDKLAILNDMEATAENPEAFAFLQHSDSVLTLRLQAASRVRLVLGRLTDRDTLTRWYRYLSDSSETALEDTAYAQRRMFMEQYLSDADIGIPGKRTRNKFPLTDSRMPYDHIVLDYTAFDLLYTITRLYDFDQNDTVDSRDAIMKKLKFGSTAGEGGGFNIDSLSNIAGDLENDSGAAENLNSLISSMQSGLLGTSQLAGLIGAGGGGEEADSGSADAEAGANLDSVISSLGDAILFYQFGDKLDNDGDGCVDEEILDEKDNDLDGFVDEDARVIPDDKPDGVDNDRNGKKDPFNPPFPFPAGNDSLEARVGIAVDPINPGTLGFVKAFMDTTTSPNNIWVKIKKDNSADMPLRLALQKDSLAVRIPIGGPVPDSLVVKLSNAKNLVGGCWRNY
jgi:tetratricopeptide (TPR) repeat protein